MAYVTRERLLTQIFGALSEADRATLFRLLGSLDEAAQQVTAATRPAHPPGRGGLTSRHARACLPLRPLSLLLF